MQDYAILGLQDKIEKMHCPMDIQPIKEFQKDKRTYEKTLFTIQNQTMNKHTKMKKLHSKLGAPAPYSPNEKKSSDSLR